MEALEELPSDMQYTDKLLVGNTTACKDPTPLSVTEDMFNNEIDGKVVDETIYEVFSPKPLWESSKDRHKYQEQVKESSKPQVASDTTPEVSSLILEVYQVV